MVETVLKTVEVSAVAVLWGLVQLDKVVDVPVVVHVGMLKTVDVLQLQFIDKGRFRHWRAAVMAAWRCLKVFSSFLRHFSDSSSELSPGSQRIFRSPRWPQVVGRRGLPCIIHPYSLVDI